jgi:polysaccharide export outer membrane protein
MLSTKCAHRHVQGRFGRLAIKVLLVIGLAVGPAGAADSPELIGPGDALRVTVFQNPDLTTETRVSGRGTITFPLVGDVNVTGLTPSQAESRIADALKQGKFIQNPQVNVAVTQVRSRQVSILGQVAKPGRYPLDDFNIRLTDVLAVAGGVTPVGADTVTVMTRRSGKLQKLEVDLPAMFRSGDLSQNPEITNGDTILVQRAPVFYIYGEVLRGGSYRLEPNMTVMQALALGGGLSLRGTQRGLRIHRRGSAGTVEVLETPLTAAVQADDVIYVRESLF